MTMTLEQPAEKTNGNGGEKLAALAPTRLPYHPAVEERFGIDKASWKALVEAIFPNASSTESVILALSYCRARKLDPFKRNVHIVPIWDKNRKCLVDTIWPGIGELRTTAFRTGEYAGRDRAEFGPTLTQKVGNVELTFPEWCQVTVYRYVKGLRVSFSGPQVYWLETYATARRDDDSPNEMWATRTRGQIEKCAEAAALRAAFPEEIGSDYIGDEAGHVLGRSAAVDGAIVQERGIKALQKKITNRPVSEGQTLEPTPEALEAARLSEDEAPRILAEKSPSAQQQPPQQASADTLPSDNQSTEDGTEGQQGPAPATPAECATPESFMDCINDAGREQFESPEKLNRWLEGKLMRIQKKGKLDKTTVTWRMDTLNLLRAGKLD